MKKKNYFLFFLTFLLGGLVMLSNSCKEDNISPSNSTNGKTKAVFNPSKTYGIVTDIDGNEYKTIVIGDQTWMAENLRTTRFRNGDPIQNITGDSAWVALSTGAYCNYKNTSNVDTIATLGRYYNWYAVSDSRNLAPIGWHVPTVAEWRTLIIYLGGEDVAGDKLRENGTAMINWSTSATNESGFSAVPNSSRYGSFYDLSFNSSWWSNTFNDESTAMSAGVGMVMSAYSIVLVGYIDKHFGFAIRCVKD